jgi:ABC-2 type transport system permease protein
MGTRASLRLAGALWGASLRSALEYRASFALQSVFMLLNNVVYLSFWGIFFRRFSRVAGWSLQDQVLMYGIVATGFGLAAVLAGGTMELAGVIAAGGLDSWLLRSPPVLVQAALSRMRISGFGDLATGPVLLLATGVHDPARLAAFAFGAVIAGVVFASFWTLVSSSAFWLGRADDVASQSTNVLITLAIYPEKLFGPIARGVLFVIVPAGLVSWLPASLVHSWSWGRAAALVAGVTVFAGFTLLAWTAGLRRYEGGSLTQAVDAS